VAIGIWKTVITAMDKHRDCGTDYGIITPDLWKKKEERKLAHNRRREGDDK